MTDRATEFDRMMNPWAYGSDGNLTAKAQQQETARTRLNSSNAPGDGGGTVDVDPAALDAAAGASDQIHGRLNGDGRAADDETTKVSTSLANWSTGKAAAQTASTWDQQIAALNTTIGELTQALRQTATNYRTNDTAVKHDLGA
ncbi:MULTISPECIES: WXG100 family type VII secretion target [unclassified Kitasatospora]|uniref:WXG100 family type VII secretion target n=1 Tax=unclassified Kitasatospora TaxID=2633591 RepID=UPI001ADFCD8B|nr:WXG100 family type VII secretion target [Kitasatospora sp. RG8]MBP0455801.1 WXG100 family type VII secretion target [Kitasatospora sp. RG8]